MTAWGTSPTCRITTPGPVTLRAGGRRLGWTLHNIGARQGRIVTDICYFSLTTLYFPDGENRNLADVNRELLGPFGVLQLLRDVSR